MTAEYVTDEIDPDATAPEPCGMEDVLTMDGRSWPAPEVRARLALDSDMPATARGFAKLAALNGWRVRATYSRGTVPQGGRKLSERFLPGKVVDAVLVKAVRGDLCVCVTWEDGHALTAWFVVPGDWPHAINITRARAIVGIPQ